MSKKRKSNNKISLFLHLLFVAAFFCWFYFDIQHSAHLIPDGLENENNKGSIYKDISDFCFLLWIVALIMLFIFTVNSMLTNGIKALKMPAIIVLSTVAIYFIILLGFMTIFKR